MTGHSRHSDRGGPGCGQEGTEVAQAARRVTVKEAPLQRLAVGILGSDELVASDTVAGQFLL